MKEATDVQTLFPALPPLNADDPGDTDRLFRRALVGASGGTAFGPARSRLLCVGGRGNLDCRFAAIGA